MKKHRRLNRIPHASSISDSVGRVDFAEECDAVSLTPGCEGGVKYWALLRACPIKPIWAGIWFPLSSMRATFPISRRVRSICYATIPIGPACFIPGIIRRISPTRISGSTPLTVPDSWREAAPAICFFWHHHPHERQSPRQRGSAHRAESGQNTDNSKK